MNSVGQEIRRKKQSYTSGLTLVNKKGESYIKMKLDSGGDLCSVVMLESDVSFHNTFQQITRAKFGMSLTHTGSYSYPCWDLPLT